jgi:hypothetical protein
LWWMAKLPGESASTRWITCTGGLPRSGTGFLERYWGKGIITHAVRALVPVAFEQYDIVRLQAGIFSHNPASMRVLEKCGFVCEAVHRNAITKHGRILDEMLYVRFREKRELYRYNTAAIDLVDDGSDTHVEGKASGNDSDDTPKSMDKRVPGQVSDHEDYN